MENPSGGSVPARVNPTPRCAGLKDEFKVVANAADFEKNPRTDGNLTSNEVDFRNLG